MYATFILKDGFLLGQIPDSKIHKESFKVIPQKVKKYLSKFLIGY
jgi:hypothetical protein